MEDLLTIIVPCYNEQEMLPIFLDAINPVRKELSEKYTLKSELLFIDDGSGDDTLNVLRAFAETDSNIRYISFSKNFGKEAGILAGLKNAKGKWCVLMDSDLQHPPKLLPDMFGELRNGGYNSVAMYRDNRKKEGFFRRHFSSMFFRLMNRLS